MYVLASAFSSEGRVVPVKLEVKELSHPKQNTLYVAISKSPFYTKKAAFSAQSSETPTYAPAAYTISIRRFMKKINTLDGDFLKYVPVRFLNREQREAAIEAKAAEREAVKRKQEIEERKKQSHGIETNLTPREKAVVKNGRKERAKGTKFTPLEEID